MDIYVCNEEKTLFKTSVSKSLTEVAELYFDVSSYNGIFV